VIRILIFVLVVATVTLPRLTDSLWLDEFSTAWTTAGTFEESFDRSLRYQGQSPLYYVFVWGWRQLTSGSEPQLRLLSFTAGLAGCAVAYATFERNFGRWGGLLAASAMLSSISLLRSLISARPYSFALLASFLSLSFLMLALRDQRHDNVRSWSFSFLLAALASYLHYIFMLVPVALAVVFVRHSSLGSRKLLVLFLALLSLLPACVPVVTLWLRRHEVSAGGIPGYGEVLALTFPFFSLLGGVFILGMYGGQWRRLVLKDDQPYLFAGMVLFLLPLVVLLAVSSFLSLTLFLPRYLLVSLPGFILLLVVLGQGGIGRPVLGVTTCLSLAWQGLFAGPLRPPEDWRAAFGSLDTEQQSTAQMLVFAGFAELRSEAFTQDRANLPYLISSAIYYAKNASFRPYPCRKMREPSPLPQSSPVILVGRNSLEAEGAMYDRCVAALEREGFGVVRTEWFGGVFVAYFGRLSKDVSAVYSRAWRF
jgi:Dolichyl-phosphate-mannose-protein mannosyltransferase